MRPFAPFPEQGALTSRRSGGRGVESVNVPSRKKAPRQYYFNKIITSRILKDSLQTNFFTHSYIVETKKTVDRSF